MSDSPSDDYWDLSPPTREQRIQMHYLAIAGRFPDEDRALIASMLAHHIVGLEDAEEPFQGGHNID